MKIRLLSIIYIFLMSLSIEAQTEEFETATSAVKNMKVGINWGWMEGTDEDWSNWIYQGPGTAESIFHSKVWNIRFFCLSLHRKVRKSV